MGQNFLGKKEAGSSREGFYLKKALIGTLWGKKQCQLVDIFVFKVFRIH